jgi:two-component system sensor histidine kinase HydH
VTDLPHLIEELLDLSRKSEVGSDLTAATGELLAKGLGADRWELRRPGSTADGAAGHDPFELPDHQELTDADIETLLTASETRFLPAQSDDSPSLLVVPLPASEGAAGACLIFWDRPLSAEPLDSRSGRILVMTLSMLITNEALRSRTGTMAKEREKQLQELWILEETNNALRGTLQLNRILRRILAGATTEMGLGFNRAALFLLNERTGLLQGMMGVGPSSAEEAEQIWESLSHHSSSSLTLSSQIELHARNQPQKSLFDARVKGMRVPVLPGGGTLSHCVTARTTERVEGPDHDPPPEVELSQRLSMSTFAATPIISRNQVFGLMVVDNIFDGKPITDYDLRLLSMFAGQAGLAIANAKEHRAHQRAAEELSIARDRLLQTERLALLGEIAAGLAHEIRNPLVTIGGFARRLEKKLLPPDPNQRYAGIIAGEVDRLEEFLDEILLFGKDRQPIKAPLQLNDIIRESVHLFSVNLNEAGITVRTNLSEDMPTVNADANQLKQVFVNLFSNALDAMPEGGELTVESSCDHSSPAAATVSVSDNGGGVEPEVLGNIFNPFYTTKSGGHGLGLALSQRIVTDHAGLLRVVNHPGRGLTFTFTLPLSDSIN